jgi:hypothetical protein
VTARRLRPAPTHAALRLKASAPPERLTRCGRRWDPREFGESGGRAAAGGGGGGDDAAAVARIPRDRANRFGVHEHDDDEEEKEEAEEEEGPGRCCPPHPRHPFEPSSPEFSGIL